MLNDTSLKVIKQLLDKYGRPIWVPGLTVNAPDTILGYKTLERASLRSQLRRGLQKGVASVVL
jgi:HK97 family phage major capsid protein